MVKLKFIPKKDLDYIEIYSTELRKNNKLFSQQKTLIDNQIKSSALLFFRMFGVKKFKKNARKYLTERKLIEPVDF